MVQNSYKIKSYAHIYRAGQNSRVKYWFWGIMISLLLFLFLPWTQNIRSKGSITTLQQDQRPQDIHSPIPGRIVYWKVKEGDLVQKGDTILVISEIKEDYLDPKLVQRTQEQLNAKKDVVVNYKNSITTLERQIDALKKGQKLKIEQLQNKNRQLKNKLEGEKAEFNAAQNDLKFSQDQFNRQEKMYQEGLVSQTQLQQRNMSLQNALSKKIVIENKFEQTQQEIINNKIEQNSAEQEYLEKISKAEAELYKTQSNIATGDGEIAKLENQVTNYTIRNGMYVLLAPQSGQITQAKKAGIGEIIKEGERISQIVPEKVNYAVEIFIEPMDLPLVKKGQNIRLIFDGFPAIIFSGWPNNSYGTFGGKIMAVENNIGPNGKFRALIIPDTKEKNWPYQLRIGSGTQSIALLNDVPIWYELWRNINGFPPDYYNVKTTVTEYDNTKK